MLESHSTSASAPSRIRLAFSIVALLVMMAGTVRFISAKKETRSESTAVPTVKAAKQVIASAGKNSRNTTTTADEDHFLEALSGYLRDDGTQRKILFNGFQLMDVEGKSIYEDPVTGKVSVKGLKRMVMSDGSSVETSADSELTMDPVTGKMEIIGESVSFHPAPKDPGHSQEEQG